MKVIPRTAVELREERRESREAAAQATADAFFHFAIGGDQVAVKPIPTTLPAQAPKRPKPTAPTDEIYS